MLTRTIRTLHQRKPLLVSISLAVLFFALSTVGFIVLGPYMRFPGEPVVVETIRTTGTLAAAAIPYLSAIRRNQERQAEDVRVVREEVKNNHKDSNFREDFDLYQQQVLDAIADVGRRSDEGQAEIRADIRGLRRDGGRRDDRLAAQDQRFTRIEQALFTATGESRAARVEEAIVEVAAGSTDADVLGDIADTVTRRHNNDNPKETS